MLSGFMVARALLIESRKDKSVNTAWNVTDRQTLEPVTAKWIEGAETMEYINSNREQSGTRITLVLRPKYAKNLSLQRLVHAVQHYMLYQPFPIQISFDEKSSDAAGTESYHGQSVRGYSWNHIDSYHG